VHGGERLAFHIETARRLNQKCKEKTIGRVILKWTYQVSVLWRGSGMRVEEEVLLDVELERIPIGMTRTTTQTFSNHSFNMYKNNTILDLGVVLRDHLQPGKPIRSEELFLLSVPVYELPVRINCHRL
jgi:hypothetical protein